MIFTHKRFKVCEKEMISGSLFVLLYSRGLMLVSRHLFDLGIVFFKGFIRI